jgi:hypothetical protein
VIDALARVAGAYFASGHSRTARGCAVVDESACQELIGDWRQLQVGGVIRVAEGGSLHWHSDDNATQIGGTWACQEPSTRTILFRWDNAMQDTRSCSRTTRRRLRE